MPIDIFTADTLVVGVFTARTVCMHGVGVLGLVRARVVGFRYRRAAQQYSRARGACKKKECSEY